MQASYNTKGSDGQTKYVTSKIGPTLGRWIDKIRYYMWRRLQAGDFGKLLHRSQHGNMVSISALEQRKKPEQQPIIQSICCREEI